MENKYIERYRSFCNSLANLEQALSRDMTDDFVLSGTIQKFTLTFDISWKVMKDIIVKYHQIESFATGSPRETLRTAASVDLISDDNWMLMLRDRNALTHDYDGKLAREKANVILYTYIPLFIEFRDKARDYMDKL